MTLIRRVFTGLAKSSTLNFRSSTVQHAKYNRNTCMTGQCLKCMKAFGKLFRSIVVSNVNSLPQQASVFHENILFMNLMKDRGYKVKNSFPTLST